MPNIEETQSKDAKVRPDHLFSQLPTQDILWVPSSQPGRSSSDPHPCILPAWATGPQWLVSSHGQALSPFPLSDCPSGQWLRLQTNSWIPLVGTYQACCPTALLAATSKWRTLRKSIIQEVFCTHFPSFLFQNHLFFSTVAVEHESKHTYLLYQDVFYT